MLNLFALHGTYYRDDENRFTAMVMCLLSECRETFLRHFLQRIGIAVDDLDLARVEISFQEGASGPASQRLIPDAKIRCGEDLLVLIEAKIGKNHLEHGQVSSYAHHMAGEAARHKRLVCVTQINDEKRFELLRGQLNVPGFKSAALVYLKWYEVLDVLRESVDLTAQVVASLDADVRQGKRISYGQRLAHLFLREVENSMYIKRVVDDLTCGSLEDVVIATQDRWFLDVLLKHRVWFPSGSLKYGITPAKYVAFYETAQGEHPQQIARIARNRCFWNRITVAEACAQPELKQLFEDKPVAEVIASWREPAGTFHIALVEPPRMLKRPIPLGKKNYAQILAKRRYSLPDFMNALTVDDLFP
jgi:hypothetical protein